MPSRSKGRRRATADLVVLAIPFAVLRHVDYGEAGFDARKNTAIQELGRGQNGKLQLQFSARYWREPGPWPGRGNGFSYTDEGYQNTWEVSRRQPGPSGILNNYTGGSVTAAKATKAPFATAADPSVQEDAETFLGVLKGVFPGGTAKWNGRASSSLPALDQNLGASYSYWRVGQYTSFAGYEGVRQGNIFFAGEHCSVDYQGYRKAARPKACARHGRSLRSSAERAGRRLACSWISVAGDLAAVGLRPHLFSHRRPQSAERRAQLALDLRARSAQRAAHHLVGRRGGGDGAPAWGEGRVRLPPPVGRGAGVRGHVSVFPLPQPVERRAFFRTPYGERGRGEGAGVTSAAIRSPSFASATAGSQAAPSIDVTIQRTACDF